MRKFLAALTVVLFILLLVPSVSSQMLSSPIRENIAFPFTVGNMQLPAGDYIFSFDTVQSRIHILNKDTGLTVSVFTRDMIDNSIQGNNKVVFQKEGSNYFLHQVWSSEAGHVHDIVHGTEVSEL